MLEGLMHLTVNGPDICTDQCDDLITSSVKNWLQTKSRRKLPSRNKGNKYNLLFYSSKNYHICSYKIIKMNWLNGRFSFIYFVYNIHHLNTEIENLNYFLGGFLINVTVISVIQYTNMPVLFFLKAWPEKNNILVHWLCFKKIHYAIHSSENVSSSDCLTLSIHLKMFH